jgi:hypothetical protein
MVLSPHPVAFPGVGIISRLIDDERESAALIDGRWKAEDG